MNIFIIANVKFIVNKIEIISRDFTKQYQIMIKLINYFFIIFKLNIIFAIEKLAKYMSNFINEYIKEIHCLYTYFKDNMHFKLFYKVRFRDNIREIINND